MNKPGYANQEFWIRLVFMLIYWCLLNLALTVFGFLVVITTIVKFASKCELSSLTYWVRSTGVFVKQIVSFLSFSTEEKPFPFQPWSDKDGE
ncbi:DUF4389 domain-containing protein [Marinomonas ostreistagni]|uniref:DUF4389 domain-containing protein n=1 Tax=Marinomonas ostreistagni TaxID=359209 RepID=A0ABS0ZES3_9GAMM|nr:DUF4389 domain-containing protein [Marinomonas ostreistagni]MBJ7551898.1 DUF4389 domain-containing protein [Marinomonas ostreistagni]